MELFNYSRSLFFSEFPLFQEKNPENLYCVFDSEDKLKEACFFQKSKMLHSFVKCRSVEVEKTQLIEHFGSFYQSWIGPNGLIHRQDKDQFQYEEKWTRKAKLQELIAKMVETYHAALDGADTEIDQELQRKADHQARERGFAKSNFLNWPKNLSESQFLVWQSFNLQGTTDDFKNFFEYLKSMGLLDSLNENQLGAELSKWFRFKN